MANNKYFLVAERQNKFGSGDVDLIEYKFFVEEDNVPETGRDLTQTLLINTFSGKVNELFTENPTVSKITIEVKL